MLKTLLSTKLNAPFPRQTLVVRSGLLATLAKAHSYRLTLVSAPPGYGKTTLVTSWLYKTDLPYAWISLDEGDNDPILFLQYFLTALHQVVPAIRLEMLDLLQGRQAASFDTLMAVLINEAAGVGDFFLVLDDFHSIHTQPIVEMLAYLVEHMPPAMHILLLTRADPPLPLSRLRTRGQLLEIRAEQLRFGAGETALFFKDVMGLKLNDNDVSAVEARTEGWVAGLQLAAIAMQGLSMPGGKDTHTFLSEFAGSHAYIMDYLTDEVLQRQPEAIRSFLQQTSILERLSGPLCEAVVETGANEPLGGQAMLDSIEQNHLFLISLDQERSWFRYHHLFKDVLNRRLETQFPQQIPELHRRASEWYEQHGFIHEAIQHAVKAENPNRTANLVEQHGCTLLMAGEVITLSDWLSSIEPYTQTHPWLAMQKAWVLLLTGRTERAEQVIHAGEKLVSTLEPSSSVRTLQGSFAAARAHWANMQGKTNLAAEYAQRALDYLTDNNDFSCSLRSVAISLLGDANFMQGKMNEAFFAYTEAARISKAAANPHMQMMANTNLAEVLVEQGQLHQAARVYAETLQLADQVDGPNSPYADKVNFGLSGVFYAWNRLNEMAVSIEKCSRQSQRQADINLQAMCCLRTAQSESARGNLEKARQIMVEAEELIQLPSFNAHWSMWAEAALARLWLDQGKVDKALLLLRSTGVYQDLPNQEEISPPVFKPDGDIPYRLEPVYLILVRLLLAQGNPDAALALCERLIPQVEAGNRIRTLVEILVLQALAFQSKKETTNSLKTLERAISLAQPEQSLRVFLDEGESMAKLLYQAKVHRIRGEFVTELLSLVDQHARTAQFSDQPIQTILVEPLTSREIEVLKNIAEGRSNQEIADQFVISVKTVKRHISNIYAKLAAKNRTQAVSFARTLRLID